MNRSKMTRRDFTALGAAALGGLMAGCEKEPAPAGEGGGESSKTAGHDPALLLQEPHVCRGLNACKGKGACKTAANDCKGKNACAGQGACATAEKHQCAGENACKGQGGCGEHPGENACKGKGECSVPLMEKAWKNARANFEKAMKEAGKTFGNAPTKSS